MFRRSSSGPVVRKRWQPGGGWAEGKGHGLLDTYLTDCLPVHLPPLQPHWEGSSAVTPYHFPAPPRLGLPARNSQALANGRRSPVSVLPPRCAVQARPRAAACQAWLIHQADTEQTRSIWSGECLLFPPLLQPCSAFC